MSKRSLVALGATMCVVLAAPATASATVVEGGGDVPAPVMGVSVGVAAAAGIAFVGTVADLSAGDGAHAGWTVPAMVLGTAATASGIGFFAASGGFDKYEELARASFISVGVGISSITVGIIGAALYGREANTFGPGDMALAPVTPSAEGDLLPGLSASGSF